MKIKSLLLGSLALAGVSGFAAGAQAADLAKGVMTSLDVCDALGLSGLTISSDTDCLQVTGGVSYMFAWGDYKAGTGTSAGGQGIVKTGDDTYAIPTAGDATSLAGRATDWDSQMIAWLQVVGTADSDFGPAKVVIKLKSEQYRHNADGYGWYDGDDTGGPTTNMGLGENASDHPYPLSNGPSGTVIFDQAYVSVGDSTVLTAGKTGSIANTDDDTPLNYLGLFNSDNVSGGGVLWSVQGYAGGNLYGYINNKGPGSAYAAAINPVTGLPYGPASVDGSGADIQTGGTVIQVTSSLGNGITLKGGLEDLRDTHAERAGTAVGVISYAGDNLTAHLTVIEAGILDGHPDVTAYHAGFTGTFDKFKLIGAIAGDSSGYYNALASAQASLDMFKLAASVETSRNSGGAVGTLPAGAGTESSAGVQSFGAGVSGSLTVSDGVSINLGGRYFDSDVATSNNEGYQIAASLVAAVTETLTLTGEIGVYGQDSGGALKTAQAPDTGTPTGAVKGATFSTASNAPGTWENTYYGAASVAWAPGGGFTSSLKGEVFSDGA
ncbi:MAG: hypothetical protein ABI377_11255, partial [Devosia sp.]